MNKEDLYNYLDSRNRDFYSLADKIWENPEPAYGEKIASDLLRETLKNEGFLIKEITDMPTAFIAEYGEGLPIIGLTGEYDSLDGLSQTREPEPMARVETNYGHGCGHNMLGTASAAAAIAAKEMLKSSKLPGTVRFYGCPAEERLSGKVLMAQKGVFDDLDACLTWHPSSLNTVWGCRFLAFNSVRFHFTGRAAHAAASPESGRSALDAVELMNIGANYLREHIPDAARLHYSITDGGGEPNIVPAKASVWYYLRAPERHQVEDVFKRLVKVAQGAAMMTETAVEYELDAACYDVMPNDVLGRLLLKNLKAAGSPDYDSADEEYARKLSHEFTPERKETSLKGLFAPLSLKNQIVHKGILENKDQGKVMAGSTDLGDVSRITPTAQFTTATWPIGTASHSWQASAASGSSLGYKGMMLAAKVLGGSLWDLFHEGTKLLKDAREEFLQKNPETYKSPLQQ